jgi:hypothetical protein
MWRRDPSTLALCSHRFWTRRSCGLVHRSPWVLLNAHCCSTTRKSRLLWYAACYVPSTFHCTNLLFSGSCVQSLPTLLLTTASTGFTSTRNTWVDSIKLYV